MPWERSLYKVLHIQFRFAILLDRTLPKERKDHSKTYLNISWKGAESVSHAFSFLRLEKIVSTAM